MPGRIANGRLASKGRLSHEWASRRMSVIEKIKAKTTTKKERKIHAVPEKIDGQVARYALDFMGIKHCQASS